MAFQGEMFFHVFSSTLHSKILFQRDLSMTSLAKKILRPLIYVPELAKKALSI